MERLIVNEGQGPAPRDLTAALTSVGSDPDCDVVLRHPSAKGCSLVIERTSHGHAARLRSGAMFHNEQPCTHVDLVHNDTLRLGETLVLYKNPAATLPTNGLPAAAPREQLAPPTFDELSIHEELEPLEELVPLDELDELEELEELEELAAPTKAMAPEVLEELEPLEELEFEALDELEPDAPAPAVSPPASSAAAVPAPPPVTAAPSASATAPATASATASATAASAAPPPPASPAPPRFDPVPSMAPEPAAATSDDSAFADTRPAVRSAEGIRFRRPLPPGRRGPSFLPPAHPGRPPR